MTAQPTTPDLSALSEDGDTAILRDGRTVRLLIRPDEITQIDDFGHEGYGSVAWINSHHRVNGYGYPLRPDGFDGNAEKLMTSDGRDSFWWQPPPGLIHGRGTPQFCHLRQLVAELVTYGFTVVTLEVLDGTDAYGRPVVVQVASLGGIDTLDTWNDDGSTTHGGYLREIVTDLLDELEVELAE